jgi:hypothetical protein
MLAERELPVLFGATLKLTVPLPLPLPPAVIVIQEMPPVLTAHVQPSVVVTMTLPFPPALSKLAPLDESE